MLQASHDDDDGHASGLVACFKPQVMTIKIMTKMATMMKMMNMLVGMACSKRRMMMMMMDMLVGMVGVACFKPHKRKRMCTQPGNSEVGSLRFRVRFPPLSQATPK